MFNELTNYRYKRDPLEAIGFYFAMLLVIMLVGMFIGSLLSIVLQEYFKLENYIGLFGILLAWIIATVGLCIEIIWTKKTFSNRFHILALVLTIILSITSGPLLGLIPVAWLTTQKNN